MTFGFFVLATITIVASPWLSVVALVARGIKDLWQHRSQFVATRWWPPFCFVVNFVVAAVIAVLLLTGVRLHG